MKWQIKDFTFDSVRKTLVRSAQSTPSVNGRMSDSQARILSLLIEKYDEEYDQEAFLRWARPIDIYKAIADLRSKFGGQRSSYISSRPHRLIPRPVLVQHQTEEPVSDSHASTSEPATPLRFRFFGPSAPRLRGDFFGRSRELSDINTYFEASPAKGRTLVIEGSPGSGKTQLARQFVEDYGDHYDLVCWIGSSRGAKYWNSSVQQALDIRAIANEIGAPWADNIQITSEEITTLLFSVFVKYERRLFILDNVDSEKSVSQLRQLLRCSHVIITTVFHAWVTDSIDVGYRIDLDQRCFDPTLGTDFLLARSGRSGSSDATYARRAGYMLGWHALALEQAAAFIATRGIDFREYLKRLKTQPAPLFNSHTPIEYSQSTVATFGVLVTHLRDHAPLAFKMLRFASYFAPDMVPVHLFWELRDAITFIHDAQFTSHDEFERECLAPLRDFSLLTPSVINDGKCDIRRIHRMVVYLLRHVAFDDDKYSVGPIPRILAMHFGGDLSGWHRYPWLVPNAISILEQILEGTLEDTSGSRQALLGSVVRLLTHGGEYELAKRILQRATYLVTHHMTGSPQWYYSTLLSFSMELDVALSSEARSRGNRELARRYDEQSLLAAKKMVELREPFAGEILDGPCRGVFTQQHCVGCRYLAVGNPEEAFALLKPFIVRCESVLRRQFAKRKCSLRRWYDGEPSDLTQYQEVLVRLLIDNHFLSGRALFAQGKLDRAELHFRRALRCASAIDKCGSVAFAIARCSIALADCLEAKSKMTECKVLLNTAGDILRMSFLRYCCSIDLPAVRQRLNAPRPLGLDSFVSDDTHTRL